MTKPTPAGPGIGPAIIVHSLDHARAALAAAAALGRPVTLLSAPGAAEYAGIAWFAKIVALGAAEWPDAAYRAVIDCADRPGLVLAALRHGSTHVRFTGPRAAAKKLSAIADQTGVELVSGRLSALDLRAEADPHAACRIWLQARSSKKYPKGTRHGS
jgi:hypothetical protein